LPKIRPFRSPRARGLSSTTPVWSRGKRRRLCRLPRSCRPKALQLRPHPHHDHLTRSQGSVSAPIAIRSGCRSGSAACRRAQPSSAPLGRWLGSSARFSISANAAPQWASIRRKSFHKWRKWRSVRHLVVPPRALEKVAHSSATGGVSGIASCEFDFDERLPRRSLKRSGKIVAIAHGH